MITKLRREAPVAPLTVNGLSIRQKVGYLPKREEISLVIKETFWKALIVKDNLLCDLPGLTWGVGAMDKSREAVYCWLHIETMIALSQRGKRCRK